MVYNVISSLVDITNTRIDNKHINVACETHQNLLWLSTMLEEHELTNLQHCTCVGGDELVYNPVYNQLEL